MRFLPSSQGGDWRVMPRRLSEGGCLRLTRVHVCRRSRLPVPFTLARSDKPDIPPRPTFPLDVKRYAQPRRG